MPSLSPTMTEGSIVQWNKKEGEEVQSGDVLCEVQTDKAVVALECEEDGILAKILVPEKSANVPLGSMIALIADSDENWQEVAEMAIPPTQTNEVRAEPPSLDPKVVEKSPPPTQPIFTELKAGPAARLLLENFGLDHSKISPSGLRGTLLKEDVLDYLQGHPNEATQTSKAVPSPGVIAQPTTIRTPRAGFTDIPVTNMRQTIAKRLTMSKTTIPHAYVRSTAKLDRVMQLRQMLKSRGGLKLSVNDVIIRACALGLRLAPQLNATTDATNEALVLQHGVDICIAVATPAGLITPILRNVDRMPISGISSTATHLAKKARDGKLQPHEFQGGSFTISNLGMFGIREFTAIINPPQVAILAVGSGLPRATGTMPDRPTSVHFENILTLTLSIDSRYVDEATAGRFLTHVSRLLSDHPELLMSDDPKIQPILTGGTAVPDHFDSFVLLNGAENPTTVSKAV